MKVWPWAIGIALLLLAGLAIGADRAASRRSIDSLVVRVADYAADSAAYARRVDSLARVAIGAVYIADSLRRSTRPRRVQADSVRATADSALMGAAFAPTAADSAGHYRDAYLATRLEANVLRGVIEDLDAAARQDSLARAQLVDALAAARERLARADSLIIDLRVAVEQLRPRWYDRAALSVGCATTPEGWCRPGVMLGVEVANLGDVVRRLPRWMR